MDGPLPRPYTAVAVGLPCRGPRAFSSRRLTVPVPSSGGAPLGPEGEPRGPAAAPAAPTWAWPHPAEAPGSLIVQRGHGCKEWEGLTGGRHSGVTRACSPHVVGLRCRRPSGTRHSYLVPLLVPLLFLHAQAVSNADRGQRRIRLGPCRLAEELGCTSAVLRWPQGRRRRLEFPAGGRPQASGCPVSWPPRPGCSHPVG